MGIGYILIGILFFVNPNINIVDILPDAVGCAFILYGMRELRDVASDFDAARVAFKRLFITEIVKLGMLITVPIIDEKEKTYILLYVLIFAAFEAVFGIMGMTKLLDGFIYSASRHGGKAPFEGESNVRSMTTVFFVVKGIFTALPELEYLQISEIDGAVEGLQLSEFKNIFIIANVLVVLLVGILWYTMTRTYLKGILADGEYLGNIGRYYETEIKPDKTRFMMRDIALFFLFITIGVVFMIDVYFDGELFHGINVLPDFVSAGFFIAACYVAKKLTAVSNRMIITLWIYFATSLPLFVLTFYSAVKFGYMTIYRIPEAYIISIISIVLTAVSALSSGYFFYLLIEPLVDIVKCHATRENLGGRQLEGQNAHIVGTLAREIKWTCISAAVVTVTSILERVFNHMEIFGWWWLVNSGLTAIFAYFVIRMLGNIREQITYSHL